jgi:hypothetical protein
VKTAKCIAFFIRSRSRICATSGVDSLLDRNSDVNDGVFDKALAADDLVYFNTAEWANASDAPSYAVQKHLCVVIHDHFESPGSRENTASVGADWNVLSATASNTDQLKLSCNEQQIPAIKLINEKDLVETVSGTHATGEDSFSQKLKTGLDYHQAITQIINLQVVQPPQPLLLFQLPFYQKSGQ